MGGGEAPPVPPDDPVWPGAEPTVEKAEEKKDDPLASLGNMLGDSADVPESTDAKAKVTARPFNEVYIFFVSILVSNSVCKIFEKNDTCSN